MSNYKLIVTLCRTMGLHPVLIAKTASQHSRQTFIVYTASDAGRVEVWTADTRCGVELKPYAWRNRPEDKIVQQSYDTVVRYILTSACPDVYIAPGVLFKPLEEVEPI